MDTFKVVKSDDWLGAQDCEKTGQDDLAKAEWSYLGEK
jgi:hypothetical protein